MPSSSNPRQGVFPLPDETIATVLYQIAQMQSVGAINSMGGQPPPEQVPPGITPSGVRRPGGNILWSKMPGEGALYFRGVLLHDSFTTTAMHVCFYTIL